jgi:xanthine dehydrogenase accessory factor
MNIFQNILSALEHEDSIMLATIIATSGSTPAAVHSKMLVTKGVTTSVGTVGGGCMEGEVILHANRLYNTRKAEILTFELNEDDIESGLICGGNLDILIEPVTKNDISLIRQLQTLRDDGIDCLLATLLTPEGSVAWKQVVLMTDDSAKAQVSVIPHLTKELDTALEKAHKKQETQRFVLPSGTLIIEPMQGTPDLIIFGGGHVSKFVAQSATMVGFSVTVVDDREKYANPHRFPEAAQTIVSDFSAAFSKLNVKPTSYVVIVTRGHSYDELVLEHAVKTPAKYIGMIGSKRKILATYEHLIARGIPAERLKSVHAPIGIDIAAATAEEIAVSIIAELIRVRRGAMQIPRPLKEGLASQL